MATYLLRIKGYSPETLPLSRLGEYLSALADLVGTDAPVHFDKVTKGSAKLKMRADDTCVVSMESRVRLAPSSDPESAARRGYERIQELLSEDKTSAEFRPENGAVILRFPGGKSAQSHRMATVREYGEFHGRIIRLGGRDATINVGLQKADGSVISCTATVEQARGLKPYLLEPIDVLVTGVGRWARTDEGHWDVSDFRISDFSPLQYDGFDEALARVRSGGSGWDSEPDIDAALHRIRYGRIAGEPD